MIFFFFLQRLSWQSSQAHSELCKLKGGNDDACQNYVRVFGRIGPERIMVCGTNAYKPLCKHYRVEVWNIKFVITISFTQTWASLEWSISAWTDGENFIGELLTAASLMVFYWFMGYPNLKITHTGQLEYHNFLYCHNFSKGWLIYFINYSGKFTILD